MSGGPAPEVTEQGTICDLIGDIPRQKVSIGGHQLLALLDTGSQITLVHGRIFNEIFMGQGLENNDFLWITAANGQAKSYSGYFEEEVKIGDLSLGPRAILVQKDQGV